FKISNERIVSEINKILLLDKEKCIKGLQLLWENRLFEIILFELQLQYNYFQNSEYHDFVLHKHTLKAIEAAKDDPTFKDELCVLWALLLHDIGKPFTATLNKNGDRYNYIGHELVGSYIADNILKRLKFSNNDREYITELIKNHQKENSILKPFDNKGKRRE
ncbi:MAG: HD domain-containing protein, partial [Candidatus Woesearchaeota archaeon]